MAPATSTPLLTEQAYQTIRGMVLDLRLLPGQAIAINELAARLGMSRTPVREAMARLCAEGLVERVSGRRLVVAIPTVETMREVYEIIAGIEGQAAKLAAQRADEDIIQRMADSVAAQEAALAADDIVAWHQADSCFHDLLLQASGNSRMREVMRIFADYIYRVGLAALRLQPKPYQSVREHAAVVAAIRTHDGELARRLHLAHHQRTVQEVECLYSEFLTFVLRLQVATRSRSQHHVDGLTGPGIPVQ